MSRSGYSDSYEGHDLYRHSVDRAIRGRRGQQALRDFIAALDAMTGKRLAQGSFETAAGEVCSLGALAQARGVDVSDLNPEHEDDDVDADVVGARLNIARSMAAEIMYENDEANYYVETPEDRWARMRAWAEKRLEETA